MNPPRVRSGQQGRVLAGLGLMMAAIGAVVVLIATTARDGPVGSAPVAGAAAIQYTLEGQIFGDGYTTGNLCATTGSGDCYHDGDQVPHRLTITGLMGGTTYTVQIQHDFQDAAGHTGYENFNSLVCTTGCSGAAALGAGVVSPGSGGTTVKTYTVTFTTGASDTSVQLDWNALLGLDAHEWNGSSLHVRLVLGAEGEVIGNKEVPLPVKQLVVPTATPTNTPTNTPTDTPTSTATSTATSTSTSTPTDTPTATATSTATNTPTSTSTSVPPTSTPTSTSVPPTSTGTPPPTSTATAVPPTEVVEIIETATPTFSPTATATPTLTAAVLGVVVTPTPVSEVRALVRAGSDGAKEGTNGALLALGLTLVLMGGGLLAASRRAGSVR